jgi:hypothetical protein
MIGIYLRKKGAGAAAPAAATTPDQTGNGLDASAGASPTDNGLGSPSVDLQGFLDAESSQLQQFLSGIQDTLGAGGGGFVNGGSGGTDGTTTGTTDGAPATTGDWQLTPAQIAAAWKAYNASHAKDGAHTQTTVSPKGTTVKVPGGAFTQVSGTALSRAAGKVRAIFVPAHKVKGKTEKAHWALPSGAWVKGPGLY